MRNNKKKLRHSKWKSTKLWFTLWATAILTFIVVANRPDFVQLGMVLAAAPLAYCYCNVRQKELYNKKEEEERQ